jgi:hypothetical protein
MHKLPGKKKKDTILKIVKNNLINVFLLSSLLRIKKNFISMWYFMIHCGIYVCAYNILIKCNYYI